jgi:hypothetical protein
MKQTMKNILNPSSRCDQEFVVDIQYKNSERYQTVSNLLLSEKPQQLQRPHIQHEMCVSLFFTTFDRNISFSNKYFESDRRAIKLTVVIIAGYHCYQLRTKFYPIFFSQG